MPKKQGFTASQHIEAGKKLKSMSSDITVLAVDVANAYGVTSELGRLAKDAQKALAKLQSKLDDAVLTQFKGDTMGTDTPDAPCPERVYY